MAKTIKNILIPVNFSESYQYALATALAMGKRHFAALHLLFVKDTENLVYPPGKNSGIMEMVLEANATTERNLEMQVLQIEAEHQVRCHFYISEGTFARAIASKAHELQADVIVLQKSKPGGVLGIMNGNSVYKVLKAVDCAVLTVPAEREFLNFKKILFPVRPMLSALEKLSIAMPIMKRNNSKVLLFSPLKKGRRGAELNRVSDLVSRASYLIGINNIDIEKEIRPTDNMAAEVVNKAIEKDADLIIITATISRGLRSVFLKDYTEKVIETSPVPVLSVKVR